MRQTHSQTNRQTDGQCKTYSQPDIQSTGSQSDRQTDTDSYGERDSQTARVWHVGGLTMHHSTAFSISASSKTSRADLPPSSMVVGTPLLAAQAFTLRPLATLPVKAILAKRGSELHANMKVSHYLEQPAVRTGEQL